MTEQVIPQEMLEARRWVLWRYEDRGGEMTKVPYRPDGRNASSVAPQTWSSIEEVEAVEPDYDGVGFVLGGGFAGIDLDGCRDPKTGRLADWAKEILAKCRDCYAEVSPSSTGIKIFGKFEGPVKGNKHSMPGDPIEGKDPAWERYTQSRYFTVTRDSRGWIGRTLGDLSAAWKLLDEIKGSDNAPETERVSYQAVEEVFLPERLKGDNTLFKLDPELYQRWSGITTGLADDSPSSVDMAIADRLAVHGLSGAEIEAALRWRRQDTDLPAKHDGYYRHTVEKALGWAKEYERRENPIGHALQTVRNEDKNSPISTSDVTVPLRFSVPIGDVWDMEIKDRWLVEGLIPMGGISLISAKPKVGKSTLSRYMAACVASGRDFLGREVGDPRQVLYVDLDGPLGVLREHTLQFREWLSEPDSIRVANPRCSELGDDLMLEIVRDMEAHEYGLVVFDTMQTVLRAKDVNDYGEMGRHFAELRRLAGEKDVAILLVHHDRKAGGFDGDATLGSTAIFGGVDTLIKLTRDGPQRYVETTQRAGVSMEQTEVTFDGTGFELGQSAHDASIARRQHEEAERADRIRSEIMSFLTSKGPDGSSKREVEAAVTGNGAQIRNTMDVMLAQRDIEEFQSGRWTRLRITRKAPAGDSSSSYPKG